MRSLYVYLWQRGWEQKEDLPRTSALRPQIRVWKMQNGRDGQVESRDHTSSGEEKVVRMRQLEAVTQKQGLIRCEKPTVHWILAVEGCGHDSRAQQRTGMGKGHTLAQHDPDSTSDLPTKGLSGDRISSVSATTGGFSGSHLPGTVQVSAIPPKHLPWAQLFTGSYCMFPK